VAVGDGRRVVGILAIVVALVGALGLPGGAATKPRVYVIGGSLTDEAKPYIDFTPYAGFVRGTLGQAPCDFLKTLSSAGMQRELQSTSVVVIETAGNSATTCMLEPGSNRKHIVIGSPEWEAKYRADLDSIFDLSNTYSVRMVLLKPPPMDPNQPAAAARNDLIDTVFPQLRADITDRYPFVSISGTARAAVGNNHYTTTMPCLPDETAAMGCNNGQITVRAPDGVSFCPDGLLNQKQPCDLPYNPGGRRFGDAIEALLTRVVNK
jgi:hypothetical protein